VTETNPPSPATPAGPPVSATCSDLESFSRSLDVPEPDRLALASFSLVGLPPASGFVSKDWSADEVASMRRAVIVRDRHCRFPGCDRPQSWCDAHHVVHWTNGGSTALHNLVLLCRRHHRLIHHRKFGVEIADGQPRFYRSDGTVLTASNRAPP